MLGAVNSCPFHNSRRSTRVPVKVGIEVLRGTESIRCEGQTIIVNLHGALILTSQPLSAGSNISIHVPLTDKRANARVVYVDLRTPYVVALSWMRRGTSGGSHCRLTIGKTDKPS
jgi:hypothetical protein